MHQQSRTLSLFLAGALLLAGASHAAPPPARELSQEETNRALVLDFYDRFFNKHDIASARVVADSYRQHNPDVPDGKAPFVSYFSGFFKEHPKSTSRIVRSATSGDLVYLHVHFKVDPNDRGQAVVDIFRVADGKIVEHWDVSQDVPEKAANRNTMF
ncbi:nuclear transport factor 2 family protein [Roseateles chitinivorans]|uniref:nuclear transport factor 2 family protein n=1 Tax=Roseateles chitinivorans TaxID=2917965 RepID=UPI003D66DB59